MPSKARPKKILDGALKSQFWGRKTWGGGRALMAPWIPASEMCSQINSNTRHILYKMAKNH